MVKPLEYLLDTDHTIDMVNNEGGLQQAIEHIGPERFAISEITLAEMCVRLSKTRLEKYEKQIFFLEKYFLILPFMAHREYGAIRAQLEKKGTRLDDMDLLIAATALHEGLVLLTGNTKHFSRIKGLESMDMR